MNLKHLQYFFSVAREGGFSNAGRALGVAQPALTRSIKSLESKLGAALFRRDNRGTKLTPTGTELYRHCEKIFAEIALVERFVETKGGAAVKIEGLLRVGMVDPFARHIFPRALVDLITAHPDVRPFVVCGPASDLCQRVAEGRLDLAWLFYVPELSDQLEVIKEVQVDFELVIAPAKIRDRATIASFFGSREVDADAVKEYPTLSLIQQDVPEARITLSSNNIELQRELVLRGAGVAVLPRFMVAADLEAGRLTRLRSDVTLNFNAAVVARRGQPLPPVCTVHLAITEKVMQHWNG